jgi:tRNA (adenine57-N1/adenine58-N1)-methyltransferase
MLYTYENRADMHARSGRNLEAAGLTEGVTRHLRDVSEGFLETEVDALFLDLREPWQHLRHAAAALADGGFFGALVPTLNQLLPLVAALDEGPFEDVEVAEVILRLFKPVPERIRPQDRLTAHTGYLVFGRKMARLARPDASDPPGDEGEDAPA